MLRTLLIAALLSLPVLAHAQTLVPPGNRSASQPKIPSGSVKRTSGTSFDAKYAKIRDLLKSDRKLVSKIKQAAKTFGIDPIHIVGALVGEHTYNVDAKDRLQSYYVKAASYLGSDLTFKYGDVTVSDLIARPDFAQCAGLSSSYDAWSCREAVWDTRYRGKSKDGRTWPNDRFGRVFFQPLYAGQTFGLGQLNPLTALKVNDIVRARVKREAKLDAANAPKIYETIMEPDSPLLYLAAVIRNAIDAYGRVGYDISRNPGITATLYNLGDVGARAEAAKRKGGLPKENYYGWLVNEKEAELRGLL